MSDFNFKTQINVTGISFWLFSFLMFIPMLLSDIRRTLLKAPLILIFIKVYLQISDREKRTEELAKWSPFSVVQVLERELNQGLCPWQTQKLDQGLSPILEGILQISIGKVKMKTKTRITMRPSSINWGPIWISKLLNRDQSSGRVLQTWSLICLFVKFKLNVLVFNANS